MKILGIETSCDETAASVVIDGHEVISNVVNSQIDIHKAYGGVVPEVAARSHIEVITPVIDQALTDANLTWSDIDAIAVTYAPGLIGSLLIGTLAARTLAVIHDIPLYSIHHVEAHVYANFLGEKQPEFPFIALVVSGGHTQLMLFKDHGDYEILGQTQDDAIGEAFDKVAKILGLPYPGGPSIANAAKNGDDHKYQLPIAKVSGDYDFSFSGLKTAVLRAVQHEAEVGIDFPSSQLADRLSECQKADFAASFQRIAVETLIKKAKKAFETYNPKNIVLAGGVAANELLRQHLLNNFGDKAIIAPSKFCTDNASMVASLGYFYSKKKQPSDPLNIEVKPSLSMLDTTWK